MEEAYTIVIPDTELLSKLCGTNDSNLRLIENYLGVEVYTRGNEITVLDASQDVHERFKYIIDRVLDEAFDGVIPCPDMITSIINSSKETTDKNQKELFADCSISISGSPLRIYPKTNHQSELINAMRYYDMVFAVGPAGSGKTFLAVAEAVSLLMERKKRRLILTRPVVESGENLGFLPGDLEQKINPYIRPLYDALEYLVPNEYLRKMYDSGMIEIAPLAYMRGRTLSNSIIILDEAQNTTCEQMKMFLTRMGEGSKVFITGDLTQIDLPKKIPSGLNQAVEVLKEIDDIKIVHLDSTDIVRNPLVMKIVRAYEQTKNNE